MFDRIRSKPREPTRFKKQIARIQEQGYHVNGILEVVDAALSNIKEKHCRSFIIYGEPQSGKTEMMIALSSKLLDEGFKIIVVLVNDDVDLMDQNLNRFARSGIDPTPRAFHAILDPVVAIDDSELIVFAKKNSKDLLKLIPRLKNLRKVVVIDDEADYATPNGKVNIGKKTRINELVEQIIGTEGIYIGVTATPARLDLNHTYENENEYWVEYPSPPSYNGKDVFFPTSFDRAGEFKPNLLPDTNDDPSFLREAIFGFLVNVAFLNSVRDKVENNYSLLIHTSGKRDDHIIDYRLAQEIFNTLRASDENKDTRKYYEKICAIAEAKYPGKGETIGRYIYENRNRNTIEILNSDSAKKTDPKRATHPSTLFTLIIGGNKVSRGVTFNNLLSMYFTRDVKHKIQQDTYIQRARMFGYREKYLAFFELHIPSALYLDWHKCFVFHRLALASIKSGQGAVWLENNRIASVSSGSINKARVNFEKGEMSFGIFEKTEAVEKTLQSNKTSLKKLEELIYLLGNDRFPNYLFDYIKNLSKGESKYIAIHPSFCISRYNDADQESISRTRGFIGTSDLEKGKYPNAVHHIKIFYNKKNMARLFYKYEGDIKFLQKSKTLG
jgi:Z1 domain-containing protein/SWI2/SNF2 ATPase-like protein